MNISKKFLIYFFLILFLVQFSYPLILTKSFVVSEPITEVSQKISPELVSLTESFPLKTTKVLIQAENENALNEIALLTESLGGTKAENVLIEIFFDGIKIHDENINVNSNETKSIIAETNQNTGIHLIEVKINSSQTVIESDYTNNNLIYEAYLCSKSNILIINDNDAENYATDNPESINAFEEALKANLYCFEVWNEKTQGVPTIEYLTKFNLLIWSILEITGTQ